jgi:hypothetical protein
LSPTAAAPAVPGLPARGPPTPDRPAAHTPANHRPYQAAHIWRVAVFSQVTLGGVAGDRTQDRRIVRADRAMGTIRAERLIDDMPQWRIATSTTATSYTEAFFA